MRSGWDEPVMMLPRSIDHHAIKQGAIAENPRSQEQPTAAPSPATASRGTGRGTWRPRPSGPAAPRSRSAPRRIFGPFLGRSIASRSRRSASTSCVVLNPRRSRRPSRPCAGSIRRRELVTWRAARRIGTGGASFSSLWPAATACEETRHCIGSMRPRGGGSITPSMRSTRRLPGAASITSASILLASVLRSLANLQSRQNHRPHHSPCGSPTANSSTDWQPSACAA